MRNRKITAIVMTFNEEKNIEDCLKSIVDYTDQIIIVDSSSKDKTLDIAKSYNCDIYQFDSPIQAHVMQWALKNCNFKNEWVIRVDSDERWTPEGFAELNQIIENNPNINGIYVRRKLYFMGKWLRYGGMYVSHFAVVFRNGFAQMEDKLMDEHLKISGEIYKSNIDVIEANYDRQQSISLWTDKHNRYSTREAIEFIRSRYYDDEDKIESFFGSSIQRKRWFKNKLFKNTPLFVRPFIYFIYRYFFQLAILDGTRGFIFTYLQAFWYRFLVDTKIYQIKNLSKKRNCTYREVIYDEFGIKI